MMRKFYAFLILSFVALSNLALAQSGPGELRGQVLDTKTKEGVPFAAVVVEANGSQVAFTQTDIDGKYVIKPVPPGKYDVRVSIIGYNQRVINNVLITSNKQTYLNPDMVSSVKNIQEVTVTEYSKPLVEIDNTVSGGSLTAEEIVKLPTRNINSLVSTTAGVYQADEGEALSVKGSRTDANDYYIDGVKVRGSTNVPQGSIEQINVITGGVPAQYGDATGGIVTITTKGPSRKFAGGVEGVTSEFLDGYGYNLVAANLSGPLILKNKGTETERPLLGFFVSGEFESKRDQDPSYVGAYEAKSDYLNQIRNNPGQFENRNGSVFRIPAGNFTRNENIDELTAQSNNEARAFNYSSRVDFQPSLNSVFAIGLSGSSQRSRVYNRANMLLNSDNNQEFLRNSYRVFGRYTQKFNPAAGEENKSILKNAYYTLQVDYSRDNSTQQDPNHKDNFFNYGHVGTFVTQKDDIKSTFDLNGATTPGGDTLYGTDGNKYLLTNLFSVNGKRDTALLYTPGSANPYIAQYNNTLIDFIDDQRAFTGNPELFGYTGLTGFQGLTGVLNGGLQQQVAGGLFNMPGQVGNLYDVNNRDQFRFTAIASADIKGHSIQIGMEYEQRIESRFRLNPRGLWTIMRQEQNEHLLIDRSGVFGANGDSVDVSNPNVTVVDNQTVLFGRVNDYGTAPQFARAIREKLGLAANDFVDIDAYDPSTFDLDMFDATDLLNNLNPSGINYTYNGYSYTGKKSSDKVSFEDFFTDTVNRPVGAFRPVYVAGFIQDKFTFRDIVFNLGVRVDRFDANQQVLKDKYSMFELRSAGELTAGRPANIPADAAVYVDDPGADPSAVVVQGYRVGDVFYDQSGNVVQDINQIRSSSTGAITPWLAANAIDGTTGRGVIGAGAFKDYEPQTQIMPRIAFSFPISDEASFFANYDVLTQRPRSNVFSNPINYYLLADGKQGITIVSPDIAPEKTINYQLGFKQKVGQTSAITLTAFYRELRDNFQVVQIASAFPAAYNTFENRDFGTIKGFTLQYDLRRTNNITVNAAYTLQFANGTGSDNNSAANLISSGESEPIRVALPLDYDQRHTIVTTVDYRYGSGTEYNGPAALRPVLENFGANFIVRAGSGTPYSRISQNIVQNVLAAGDTRFRRLVGEINGSRLPWQYNLDIRLDKDFYFNSGAEDGKGKSSNLNVYLLVQNALNTKRVANVYPATGLPDDDGYLTSPQAEDFLSSDGVDDRQAYVDMYRIVVNDPNNFRLPRVIRLGAIYNF